MAIDYQQTDTSFNLITATCAANNSPGGALLGRLASSGGTPGTVEDTLLVSASATGEQDGQFRIIPGAGISWDAGTWTVRFNVTTANMNLTITDIYICRANSSDVNQATIGSATGLSLSLGTTGVITQAVTGSGQSPAVNDRVYVCLQFANSAMSTSSFGFTPSELISSPFSVATTTQAEAPYILVSRMRTW